jgi:hypothetical protein
MTREDFELLPTVRIDDLLLPLIVLTTEELLDLLPPLKEADIFTAASKFGL